MPVSEDSFDGWVCRLTAVEKTWDHARRKRRLAQQLASKKLKNADGEDPEVNVNAEETSDTAVPVTEENVDVAQASENPSGETLSLRKEEDGESSGQPLLTCELWVEIESSESEEAVAQDDMFRIWMIFENGSGGLEVLQSLRQYLMNMLGVKRPTPHDPSKSVKKRRKRTKKHSSEGVTQPPNQP